MKSSVPPKRCRASKQTSERPGIFEHKQNKHPPERATRKQASKQASSRFRAETEKNVPRKKTSSHERCKTERKTAVGRGGGDRVRQRKEGVVQMVQDNMVRYKAAQYKVSRYKLARTFQDYCNTTWWYGATSCGILWCGTIRYGSRRLKTAQ